VEVFKVLQNKAGNPMAIAFAEGCDTNINAASEKAKGCLQKVREMNSILIWVDLELTGIDPVTDIVREITWGCEYVEEDYFGGWNTKQFHRDGTKPLPGQISHIRGVKVLLRDMQRVRKQLDFAGGGVYDFPGFSPAGWNVAFDRKWLGRMGMDDRWFGGDNLDVCKIARKQLPQLDNHKLDTVAEYLKLPHTGHAKGRGNSRGDIMVTRMIWQRLKMDEPKFKIVDYDDGPLARADWEGLVK
jgi:hypothetical protein